MFTGTMLRMYIREAAFFAELAEKAPVRVPICHHSTIDAESSEFVLVMEDLGDLRIVDQVKGMEIADAEQAVDGLAAWHATWWGQALELAERGVTVSLGDPIYKAVLPMVFAEGWEKLGKELTIPEAIQAVAPRWTDAMRASSTTWPRNPPRCATATGEPTTSCSGPTARWSSSTSSSRRRPEGPTTSPTSSRRASTGRSPPSTRRPCSTAGSEPSRPAALPPEDNATAWEDYRKAALFCLVYPVVAWRGMDAGDPRQVDLATTMLDRFDRAVDSSTSPRC